MDVPCPNFEVCESHMDSQMRTCGNCAFRRIVQSKKDILTFKVNVECPVCLECKRGVTNINCDHYVCIECFKELHKYESGDNPPPFPYDEMTEEDYDENPEKYENDTIINVWLDCCKVYYDEIDVKYYERNNLRICPLCRL